jgi:hypothetical protein
LHHRTDAGQFRGGAIGKHGKQQEDGGKLKGGGTGWPWLMGYSDHMFISFRPSFVSGNGCKHKCMESRVTLKTTR